ncbi:MAG: FxsA family protein [Planctomycetaceae bacterium]
MLLYLLLLLIVVPVLELVILLQVHHAVASEWGSPIGLLVSLGTIVVTGVAGAALARHQGIGVWREMQMRLGRGELPGQAAVDGVLILIGAAFLITPGFLTDLLGFSLLVPLTRSWHRRMLIRWFRKKIARGEARFTTIVTDAQEVDEDDRLDGPA